MAYDITHWLRQLFSLEIRGVRCQAMKSYRQSRPAALMCTRSTDYSAAVLMCTSTTEHSKLTCCLCRETYICIGNVRYST